MSDCGRGYGYGAGGERLRAALANVDWQSVGQRAATFVEAATPAAEQLIAARLAAQQGTPVSESPSIDYSYQTSYSPPAPSSGVPPWIWLVGGVAALGGIYLVTRRGE